MNSHFTSWEDVEPVGVRTGEGCEYVQVFTQSMVQSGLGGQSFSSHSSDLLGRGVSGLEDTRPHKSYLRGLSEVWNSSPVSLVHLLAVPQTDCSLSEGQDEEKLLRGTESCGAFS